MPNYQLAKPYKDQQAQNPITRPPIKRSGREARRAKPPRAGTKTKRERRGTKPKRNKGRRREETRRRNDHEGGRAG
jgi:hypothetical protein